MSTQPDVFKCMITVIALHQSVAIKIKTLKYCYQSISMKKIKNLLLIFLILPIFLTSCSLPGLGGNTKTSVVVATGSNTERQILGEVVKQIIEHHSDIDVSLITNLSSSVLNHIAMLKGDVNIVGAMYTGTALSGELGMDPIKDPKEAERVVMD